MDKLFRPIGKIILRDADLPICSKCVHFIEPIHTDPYDRISRNDGRCRKFGKVNLITGAIEQDLASVCRSILNQCGKEGSEYTEKRN
jgi:hypothetical protein